MRPSSKLSIASADEDLVAACLNGDPQAWEVLIDKYKNLVYSVPVKYRMPPEDASDVFQAVWMDLHADLPTLREPAAIRGWLVTTASHKCFHWKKRQKRAAEDPTAEMPPEPRDANQSFLDWKIGVEREQMLREAISRLPGRCQSLVRMLFFQDPPRPYDEVARSLGLAKGSIGFIRGRCLSKLKRLLTDMGF